jgi:anti-sigma regulatory factor (Ser/Thr protein kinase)
MRVMPVTAIAEKDFIGRDHELQSLFHIVQDIRNDCAVSLFLSGQQGSGKSELLKQLFSLLFWKQNDVVPFFYPIGNRCTSLHDFSGDYLNKFVCQWLAFQTKEVSTIYAKDVSLEKTLSLAEKFEAHWAVDIIKNFLQHETSGNLTELFFTVISTPYYSYTKTNIPVVVLLDNFHKIKDLDGVNAEKDRSLWKLFDEILKNRRTPHIITGSREELMDMLFQQTSIGESLELFNLPMLDKSNSSRLLSSFSRSFHFTAHEETLLCLIDLFNNNLFYMKNFIQSARHSGKDLTADDLFKVYSQEITSGKFYAFWMSRLKACMPNLELRRASLEVLHYLCRNDDLAIQTSISEMFSISIRDFNSIVAGFQKAGIIESNFSTLCLVQDRVLRDVIRVLYSTEILKKPIDIIEEEIITDVLKRNFSQYAETVKEPLLEISFPSTPQAELIAVNALEHIAREQNIPAETTKQLQIALIELYNSMRPGEKRVMNGYFHLKIESSKGNFVVQIKIADKELLPPDSLEALAENQLVQRYTDDCKIEQTKNGVKITLLKKLANNPLLKS